MCDPVLSYVEKFYLEIGAQKFLKKNPVTSTEADAEVRDDAVPMLNYALCHVDLRAIRSATYFIIEVGKWPILNTGHFTPRGNNFPITLPVVQEFM